jgi:S-formylglutathione hydrolase FrmB
MALLHRGRHETARARARHLHRRVAGFVVLAVVVLALVFLAVLFATRANGVATDGARIIGFTIDSPLVHEQMPVTAVIPEGSSATRRPLLIFLHGKGGNQNSSLGPQLFAALASLGASAPDVVFPYGGPDSYWHDRADGAWGSYVYDEVLPQAIARLGADPSRVAIGGVSMGGFGALNIARLHPGRFCAVGGHSAALWPSAGDTAPGAFDDAADFARNDIIGAARAANPYRGMAVWLDAGNEDPFLAADTTLATELRADHQAVQFHVWPGSHEISYWDSHWGDYLRFYAGALAACQRG